MLNVGGKRKSFKVKIISAAKVTDHDLTIPLLYQQDENSVENSCVWLAIFLVIRSVDEPLAEVLLKQYHDDLHKLNDCIYSTKVLLIIENYLIFSSGLRNNISVCAGLSNH